MENPGVRKCKRAFAFARSQVHSMQQETTLKAQMLETDKTAIGQCLSVIAVLLSSARCVHARLRAKIAWWSCWAAILKASCAARWLEFSGLGSRHIYFVNCHCQWSTKRNNIQVASALGFWLALNHQLCLSSRPLQGPLATDESRCPLPGLQRFDCILWNGKAPWSNTVITAQCSKNLSKFLKDLRVSESKMKG